MKGKILGKEFLEIASYKDTTERAVKQELLQKTITCIILAFVAGTLTLLNIHKHFTFMTITTSILTIGLLIAALLCGYWKRADLATILVAILGIFIFTYYAISGANDGFAILWITMVPLISMLWMGFRIGFLTSLYFQVLLIVIFHTGLRERMGVFYTEIFMTRFPLLYMGTFMVSTWIFFQKLKMQMLSDTIGRKDSLTLIDNRLGYDLKISTLFQEELISYVQIVVFDVNRLKYVNDKYGHKAGDEIIISVSKIIKKVFYDYDIFARVGGDEFILVSVGKPFNFEERKKQLKEAAKKWKGEWSSELSISCGYSQGQNVTEEEYGKLLQVADNEMYKDKKKFYEEQGIERRKN